MSKELSIEEIKALQLEILNHLDAFCRENGIKYALCNGSLLGAIKYHGYIPWDDDIDVCLLREDYNRLVKEHQDPQGRFSLRCFERDRSFLFPFAKMEDTNTDLVEAGSKSATFGVNIDVFPIDSFGDTPDEVENTSKIFNRLRKHLNCAKLRSYSSRNIGRSILKFGYCFPFRLVGAQRYCKRIMAWARRGKGRYYGDVVWGFYGPGEAFQRAMFEEMTEVEFEGRLYPAPRSFDEYLTGLYGDWRQDPPPEKQKTHHSFKAYKK